MFVSEVGLFSIIHDFQFDHGQTYMAYHHCIKVYRNDGAFVESFPCLRSRSDLLNITAREATSTKLSVEDI